MATGASTADLAIILVDAVNGLLPQSRRHAFISSLLQIPHIVIAVNKMDLVNWDEQVYRRIVEEFSRFAEKLEISDLRFIPISALLGDHVVHASSSNMPWYRGPSLLELLETIHIRSDQNLIDLRFPVQWVSRPDRTFRGYCGQVSSGILRKGSDLLVLPSMKTTRVKSILTHDGELDSARPGQAITLCLENELDISRGDMLVHPGNRPMMLARFEAMLVWMDEKPLLPGETVSFLLKTQCRTVRATVDTVQYRVNVNALSREDVNGLELNEIGRVALTSNRILFLDEYRKNRANGHFILISEETHRTVAAGMVIQRDEPGRFSMEMALSSEEILSRRKIHTRVSEHDRIKRNGHRALTLWFTGLLSSGKVEAAILLEKELFDRGIQVKVLWGRQVRRGLSRDLGFSSEDTFEHLRRVAELAKTLNDAGILVIAAFISADRRSRDRAAKILGTERFREVYFKASVEWCSERDQTGLYQSAFEKNGISLPGVTFPYEEPENPDFQIDVERCDVNEMILNLNEWLQQQL
jgi:bifunctional enzyme CysN/CysC